MALGKARIHAGGESPYEHERKAIAFVLESLEDRDPFEAWTLQEVVDRSTGRLLEVDLLVLGPHALYVVEIKSYPDGSELIGDAADWSWRAPGSKDWRPVANPYRVVNHKAKVIKGLLGRSLDKVRAEALVFVSTENIDRTRLSPDGRMHVVFRGGIVDALTRAEFPGAHPKLAEQRVDRPMRKAIVQQLKSAGIRARRVRQKFGNWELQGELSSGQGWQEYLAFHASLPRNKESGQARVRVYRRPPAEDSAEDRNRLRKIAEREFQSLYQLRDCRTILAAQEFLESEVTHDPAIVFEAFSEAVPFSSYVRQNPDLSFDQRLHVIEQVADALQACHRKDVIHRGLHPDCVLVRPRASGRLEVRVAGFQHARESEPTTLLTLHTTELTSPEFLLYRAPEMLHDQEQGSPESDVFSLAAFTYFALTGQAPAQDPTDLIRILRENGGLRPGDVQDDLIPIDPVIQEATQVHPSMRPDVSEFFDQLEEAVTAPANLQELADPLDARAEDRLEGGLCVIGELGRGSSARVLEVEAGDPPQRSALKVPLDGEREELLRAEAEVLERLDHPGVVRLLEVVRPSGRTCLRLRLADRETLHDRLRKKGPPSLDLAHRYGRDLLETLHYLETQGVTHRDVKPHNLGFTREDDKKQSRLLLFDFSLSPVEPERVQLGTIAYRDPWLADRRSWDAAADRYAAAVTLHEMLTGIRPDYGDRVNPAAVHDAKPQIDPLRFEDSVRAGLVQFFDQALAARLDDRFESADDMRFAWEAVFRTPEAFGSSLSGVQPTEPFLLPADLSPSAPLQTFVLSPLLLDALTRGRAETALDVARLPRNRLSAVPGVGKETQAAIFSLITALQERFRDELRHAEPLVPGFGLGPEPLQVLPRDLLDDEALGLLHAGGVQTTVELARTPADRVERLLAPCGVRATRVRRQLEAYERQADAAAVLPTSLGGWLDLFLQSGGLAARRSATGSTPQLNKTRQAGWAWLGLPTGDASVDQELGNRAEDPLERFPRTGEIARATASSAPTVSNAIGRARDQWQAHAHKDEFIGVVRQAVRGLGGAASLADLADRMRAQLAAVAAGDDTAAAASDDLELDRRRAAALLRIATLLVDADGQPGLVLGPWRDGRLWCSADPAGLEMATALGQTADELVGDAARPTVPPLSVARQRLEDTARPFVQLVPGPDLLLPLAARASRGARCSRKLELYPEGLAADAALNLARAAVQSAVSADGKPWTVARLREVIAERYPGAAPLPDRPAVDGLLDPLGLTWSDDEQGFIQKPAEPSALPTIQRTRRTASASRGPRTAPSGREIQAGTFRDTLKLAVEKQVFRFVQCLDTEYTDTIAGLSAFLGAGPISFERLLIEEMDRLIAQKNIDPEVVLRADRAIPSRGLRDQDDVPGSDQANLRRLAMAAAERVLPAVTPSADGPRLVVHLGLIARFRLTAFLDTWLRACEEGRGHAVFAVAPSEQADDPTIDGWLPVPLTSLGSQRLWVDSDWLRQMRRTQHL